MRDAIITTGHLKEAGSQQADSYTTAEHLALEVLHEIRNPLEALGNLTYLTYEEADDPEQVRMYMRLAWEQMVTLNRIASQTLGYARSSPTPQSADLAELMKAAIRIHQKAIDENQIQLIQNFPLNQVMAVYSGELLQVFSNLIANALDALPNGGILRLRFRKRQNEIHFIIADSGQGIANEHLGKVFEPFFTTKQEKGTGIGLALSKRIVEHHRGRIRVRSSVRPGKSGTTFRISLAA